MFLGHRSVDFVVVTHCISNLAILARHPALDVGRLSAYLIAVGVDYYCCV